MHQIPVGFLGYLPPRNEAAAMPNRDPTALPGGNTGATALTDEPAAAKDPPSPQVP